MVLFCKAAVEVKLFCKTVDGKSIFCFLLIPISVWRFFQVPWYIPCGGVCYGDGNLAFIANDWHTALLPVYLKAYYRDHGIMKYTRSVLVIHNIAHQVSKFFIP